MSVQYVIGIDGGGTKTHGRIKPVNTNSTLQKSSQNEAYAGSCSLTNDFELACANIVKVCRDLMQSMNCDATKVSVVIGVAGGGSKVKAEQLKAQLLSVLPFACLEICNDAKTSLIGANNGKPVTVVALGTGSVGARLDNDNQEHYYGGWGFPVGDDGGGAKLGFYATQQLLQDIDNNNAPTSELTKQVHKFIGDDIPTWLRQASAAKYAELCPLIFQLHGQCTVADTLIEQHVEHCESLILTSRANSNTPIALLGGLAKVTLPLLSKNITEHCQLIVGTSLDGACFMAENNITSNNAAVNKSGSANKNDSANKSDSQQTDLIKNFTIDPVLLQQLDSMKSEGRNANSQQIDLMDSKNILTLINNEDKNVPLAVSACLEPMSSAVDAIVEAFNKGGRLVYIGAGTSGRLGVLDAVECPPTFSVSTEQVVGLIAGGQQAIYKAVEGAEDNKALGQQDLVDIEFNVNDVLVGIAASGRTPYVIGALEYANQLGAQTVCVVCNPGSEMTQCANIVICPEVGPEVLTGSTRLKSGTAQKLVLNMLSTASMIRTGKSYENLMVDVNATNKKLFMRAIRIVMQATKCDANTAEQALKTTNLKVKLAILHILTGVDSEKGLQTLTENNGFLRRSVEHLS